MKKLLPLLAASLLLASCNKTVLPPMTDPSSTNQVSGQIVDATAKKAGTLAKISGSANAIGLGMMPGANMILETTVPAANVTQMSSDLKFVLPLQGPAGTVSNAQALQAVGCTGSASSSAGGIGWSETYLTAMVYTSSKGTDATGAPLTTYTRSHVATLTDGQLNASGIGSTLSRSIYVYSDTATTLSGTVDCGNLSGVYNTPVKVNAPLNAGWNHLGLRIDYRPGIGSTTATGTLTPVMDGATTWKLAQTLEDEIRSMLKPEPTPAPTPTPANGS